MSIRVFPPLLLFAAAGLLAGCGLSLQHAREDAAACVGQGLTPGTAAFAECRQKIARERPVRPEVPRGEEAIRGML